jgi:hypothetical protein
MWYVSLCLSVRFYVWSENIFNPALAGRDPCSGTKGVISLFV